MSGFRFLLQRGEQQPEETDSRYWYAAKRAATGRSAFDLLTGEPSDEPFEAVLGSGELLRGWVERGDEPPS